MPTRSQGSITIDTTNAAITMPGVFDDPRLTLRSARRARGLDRRDATAPGEPRKAFTVQRGNAARVKNADAEGEATAYYRNQGHGRGSLDLKAKVARRR